MTREAVLLLALLERLHPCCTQQMQRRPAVRLHAYHTHLRPFTFPVWPIPPPGFSPAPCPRAGSDAGGSPVKIALFSLGNMCAHKECREALLALGVTDVIRRLSSNPDPTQQKYLQRIQQKLAGAAAAPLPAGRG